MPTNTTKNDEPKGKATGAAGPGKDLGNFTSYAHSRLAAHFQATRTGYSTTTYDPIAAFLPGRLLKWIPQVAKYWFHKKHSFRDYTAQGKGTGIYEIEDRVKIGIAGDWGTGTDEAKTVAAAMEKADPDFTIHLGDVYYVGDSNEVRENFLGEKTSPYAPVKWPMGAKGSFALNGNHEMYADGNGYWRHVLPRMGLRERGDEWGEGQWASFFCLENKHWRIIGLDTGYNSTRFDWGKMPVLQRSEWLRKTTHLKPTCALPEPLVEWLASSVNPDGDKRGLILLSHHGPHSGFESWYQIPSRQLAKMIHRPVLWIWGHEHRLAIYEKFGVKDGVEAHGRCLGHGGMPVERGAAPDIQDCRWLAWDNRRYPSDEKVNVGYNGYANFSFNGPALHIAHYDLNQSLVLTEDWHVDIETGELEGPKLRKVMEDASVHWREE
ncbi:MAG: metallophosphoesterase [Candidatus Acidiferrales bacterium]